MLFFAAPFDAQHLKAPLLAGICVWSFIWMFRKKSIIPLALILLLTCLGTLLTSLRATWISSQHQMLSSPLRKAHIEGQILEIEKTTKGFRYLVRVRPDSHLQGSHLRLKNIRVSTHINPPSLSVGDHVEFQATLFPISGALAPQGYDFRRQAFFQGLSATGFMWGPIHTIHPKSGWSLSINELRHTIQKRLHSLISDTQIASIATALITSERTGIRDDTNHIFNRSGLAHILSISGLHFSILAGLVFLFCRRSLTLIPFLAYRYDLKKVGAVFVMASALVYALIAGMNVPVVRSLIMIIMVMVAILFDREPFTLRLVSFAALLILAFTPEAIMTASFQMSFAAVIALVSYYEHEKENARIIPHTLWWRYLILPIKAVVITTTLATLATAPFTITHFGRMTLYAVLANALAIPLTAILIMPAVLMFFVLYPFNLDFLATLILEFGIGWLIKIAQFVSGIPHSIWICPPLYPWAESLFMITFITGGLCWAIGKNPLRRIGGGLVFLSFGFTFFAQPYDVICQKEPFILAFSSGKQATFIGSPSQFLINQWSKALGIDEKQAAIVPLCQNTLKHSASMNTHTSSKHPCLHLTHQKHIQIGALKVSQKPDGLLIETPNQRHLLTNACSQVALSMDQKRLERKCLSRTTLFW